MTDAWRWSLPCFARRLVLCLVWVGLLASPALADGGHVALHAISGEYAITVFTTPVPLVAGRCDLSLLVQDAQTGAVVADASGTAILTLGAEPPRVLSFVNGAAGSPLLAAITELNPGKYMLRINVERAGASVANASGGLTIAANPGRRMALLYGLGLPCAVISLFLLNQYAKLKMAPRKGVRGESESRTGP